MGDVVWNKVGVSGCEGSLAGSRPDRMDVWGGRWNSVGRENEFLHNEQIRLYYQVVRKRVSAWARSLNVTSTNLSVFVRVGWSYSTPLFQLLTSYVRWRPIAEKLGAVFLGFYLFCFFFFFGLLISVNTILRWGHLHLFLITSQLQELLRKNIFLQVQGWENEDICIWPNKIHVAQYLLLSDKNRLGQM